MLCHVRPDFRLLLVLLIALRATPFGQTIKSTMSSPALERRDQHVTEDDLRILQRADKMLSTPAAWNRHDTRVCKGTDTRWSLFCALQLATVEVFGEERYRAVAIQEVRFVTEDLMRGMNVPIQHRLTDYNNLPSTQFKDVKHVLKMATDRVRARLATQKQ
jgi:hypothetical protein